MKNFVLLALTLCAIFAAIPSGNAAPPELSAPAVAAYDKLRVANVFALGGVGIVGATSQGETAFRELQREPNATEVFIALLDDPTASKAGQLYALFGLKEAKSAEFEVRLPAFLEDDALVETQSGCIRVSVEVKNVAARFAEKK